MSTLLIALVAISGLARGGPYEAGLEAFKRGDHAAAFRSLAELAPFDEPQVGVHARYLIGRIHHLAGERPEAAANYEAAVAAFERQRKEDPKSPTPDHVARALFYWGVILSEFGEAEQAASRFAYAVQLAPDSPIAPEARLRGGICAVQVKRNIDAVALLAPLADHAQVGGEALRWLAKAQYGLGATPVARGRGFQAVMNAQPDPQKMAQGIDQAIQTYKAAAKAGSAQVLLDLGDMQQLDRVYREAAEWYAAASSAGSPELTETALLRRAIALQLAGDFEASDKACLDFIKSYAKSPRAAEAMLRHAENALLARRTDAAERLGRVVQAYPNTVQAQVAQFGLAATHYLQGRYKEAAAAIEKIPAEERTGDAFLVLADCQLRALPADVPEDALSTARLVKRLEDILAALEANVQDKPSDSRNAQTLIRIGYAANRLHPLLAEPMEKRRAVTKARRAYATFIEQFGDHPLYPVVMLENAKTIASFAGAAPAVMELSKFGVEPLSRTAIAPLALIHQADALRLRRKPDDAAELIKDVRARYEAELQKDPHRSGWVVIMRQVQGLSLKESGDYAKARETFASIVERFPDRPQAKEAVWRIAQCELDPAMAELEVWQKALAKASRSQAQDDVLGKLMEQSRKLEAAAKEMGRAADKLAASDPESPVLQKMRHDEAWAWRAIGEVEVEAERRRLRSEAAQKLFEQQPEPDKLAANGRGRGKNPRKPRTLDAALASIPVASVPLSSVPLRPTEKVAREKFRAVIEAGEESPLAAEARIELADLYAQRGEIEPAIALLKAAVDAASEPDVVEGLRIRLAGLHLENGDPKSAQSVAEPVLETGGRNVYSGYARVVIVEALYRLGQWQAVIEQGREFADVGRFSKLPGVSDHASLRVALAQQKLSQWEQSRATLETVAARFGKSSPLMREIRESLATAYEKLNQPEKAAAQRLELERLGAAGPVHAAETDSLTPRIPNLLTISGKRSKFSAGNPISQPAEAVTTPPVNNIDGTADLPPLALTARPMEIEIVPPPQPLAFDAEPYVKSPAAPDDR